MKLTSVQDLFAGQHCRVGLFSSLSTFDTPEHLCREEDDRRPRPGQLPLPSLDVVPS